MTSKANRFGFTLLELMAVVAIMGLVFTVITVRAGGLLATSRLDAAARRMESLIRLGRSQAVVKNRLVILYIDGGRIALAYEKEEPFATFLLPRGVTCSQVRPAEVGRTVRFSPRGSFPSFVVEFTGPSDNRICTQANGLNGQVQFLHERNGSKRG